MWRLPSILAFVLLAGAPMFNAPRAENAPPSNPGTDPFGFTTADYAKAGAAPIDSTWWITDVPFPDPNKDDYGGSGHLGNRVVRQPCIFGIDGDLSRFTLAQLPEVQTAFKATAPKGPHWPVFHLGQKWNRQSFYNVPSIVGVLSIQTAEFGSLYCLTYVPHGQPAVIREYAFVPVAGVADRDWQFYLQLDPAPLSHDATHAEYGAGDDSLRLAVPGWLAIDKRKLPADAPLQVRGWTVDPKTNHGAIWRTAVGYIARGEQGVGKPDPRTLPEPQLTLESLVRLRQRASAARP